MLTKKTVLTLKHDWSLVCAEFALVVDGLRGITLKRSEVSFMKNMLYRKEFVQPQFFRQALLAAPGDFEPVDS